MFTCANGAWTTTTCWSPVGTPTCGDVVIIPCGKTCSITTQIDLTGCSSPLDIRIQGVLWFKQGVKLRLPCGTKVTGLGAGTCTICGTSTTCATAGSIVPESTSGANNQLEVCGTDIWIASDGTLTGPFLPIELMYFDAVVCNNNRNVCLNWATASEKNNDYFTVERSVDGAEFTEVTKVQGSGTSYVKKYYSAIDEHPLNDVSYYRLKQTDIDKSFSYSPIVAVALDFEISVQNPSPAFDIPVVLKGNKGAVFEVKLVDVLGKTVYNESITLGANGNNKLDINLANRISSGIVYLVVSNNLKTAKIKVVID